MSVGMPLETFNYDGSKPVVTTPGSSKGYERQVKHPHLSYAEVPRLTTAEACLDAMRAVEGCQNHLNWISHPPISENNNRHLSNRAKQSAAGIAAQSDARLMEAILRQFHWLATPPNPVASSSTATDERSSAHASSSVTNEAGGTTAFGLTWSTQ